MSASASFMIRPVWNNFFSGIIFHFVLKLFHFWNIIPSLSVTDGTRLFRAIPAAAKNA